MAPARNRRRAARQGARPQKLKPRTTERFHCDRRTIYSQQHRPRRAIDGATGRRWGSGAARPAAIGGAAMRAVAHWRSGARSGSSRFRNSHLWAWTRNGRLVPGLAKRPDSICPRFGAVGRAMLRWNSRRVLSATTWCWSASSNDNIKTKTSRLACAGVPTYETGKAALDLQPDFRGRGELGTKRLRTDSLVVQRPRRALSGSLSADVGARLRVLPTGSPTSDMYGAVIGSENNLFGTASSA